MISAVPTLVPADEQDRCSKCGQGIISNAQWADDLPYCLVCGLELAGAGIRLHGSRTQNRFWDAADRARPGVRAADWLEEEVPVIVANRRFRVDFQVRFMPRIVIELDSFTHHSSSAAITRDRKRQRLLQLEGRVVIRFSGSEVWQNAPGCVEETIAIIAREVNGYPQLPPAA